MSVLTDCIAPAFYEVHKDIKSGGHTYYMLKGGRGSTKSTFAGVEVILGIIRDKNANAVVLRRYQSNIKDSVYEQIRWGIEKLGLSAFFRCYTSPLEIVYIPTGQKILFRGADDPTKIKSLKVAKGYVKYVWFEELDQFRGMAEIRSINQSLLRGGKDFIVFYTYNPPQSQRSWVNEEAARTVPDRFTHHSTYLDVPREWLGERFILDAEHLKESRPEIYAHEYMGEVTGTGGEVFTNVTLRSITREEIQAFDRIKRGIDFGFAADPFVYLVCNYDKTRRKLYIFDEIYKAGLANAKASELIKQKGSYKQPIIADSAEPKSINELRMLGHNIRGAKKGKDSIEYGIKFMQSLDEIVIDDRRCPNAAREFYGYELERDARGEFKAGYPDRDNHTIDAARYALEDETNSRKVKIYDKAKVGLY
jgi:PBSX family phage terminase large subunit